MAADVKRQLAEVLVNKIYKVPATEIDVIRWYIRAVKALGRGEWPDAYDGEGGC